MTIDLHGQLLPPQDMPSLSRHAHPYNKVFGDFNSLVMVISITPTADWQPGTDEAPCPLTMSQLCGYELHCENECEVMKILISVFEVRLFC